jgi:two-component sensor histidine kinase
MSLSENEHCRRAEPDDLREANHRIANSLALVSALVRMQAGDIFRKGEALDAHAAGSVLLDAAGRIESVSKLHRLLSNETERADLTAGPYLGQICAGISGSLATSDTVAYIDESGAARLAPDRLSALGLFLTEALTNAFKHAHPAGAPGSVEVDFRRRGHDLELEIRDDGVGLPEGFDAKIAGGLGFRIMRALAGQMNATLSYPERDFGTCVRLDIPVAVALRSR